MSIILSMKQGISRNSGFVAMMLWMSMLSIPTAFAAPTLYIFQTPMQQVSGSLPFAAHNQSLRGPGVGTSNISIPLFYQSWNPPAAHAGTIVTGRSAVNAIVNNNDVTNWIDDNVMNLDGIKFGGTAGGDTSGSVDFKAGIADMTDGQVNVDLPVNVVLDFPQANTFRGGDTIVIRSRYAVDNSRSNMTTTPLGGALTLDGAFVIHSGVNAEICIKDCAGLNKRVNVNESRTIVRLPSDGVGYKIDPLTTAISGVTGTVFFPSVTTSGPSKYADGTMEDRGQHQFTRDLNIDIDSYLKYVGGPPLGLQTPKIKGVQVGYDIINYSFDVSMTQKRHVKFKPDAVEGILNLGTPMNYAILDGSNETVILNSGSGAVVHFKVGDSIALTLPAAQVTETAASSDYTLRNAFTHEDDMVYQGAYKNQALKLNFTVPKFEIYGGSSTCLAYGWRPLFPESHCHKRKDVCIGALVDGTCYGFWDRNACVDDHTHWPEKVCIWKPSIPKVVAGPWHVNLGHLATASIPLPSTTDHFLPRKSHELAFASQSGPAFSIDPENPVIVINKEASKVVNHGGGSRTVTYTMLVRNDGDVPLDAVQVKDLLTGTFNGAAGFSVDRVHSCKLTANPSFDGAGDAQLVMPVYTLDPAEEAVIELQVSVIPQAFPPLYANIADTDGISVPRGTTVNAANAADAATVNMGPAEVTALSDFVLFADEEVELDGMLNSSGHIGANEKIKVGEHNNSILAGDLRAREEIKVEGLLTADYAISGDGVEQEDDGVLTLTGGQVRDDAMAIYPLPQAVFTAGGLKVKVKAADASVVLAPGSYGKVRIEEGGVLLLTAGEYFFASLRMDSENADENRKKSKDAKEEGKHDDDEGDEEEVDEIPLSPAMLGFDTSAGPVVLNIAGKLRLGDAVQLKIVSNNSSTRDVAINIQQDDELLIAQGVSVQGILSAPNAELEFATLSSIEGAAYAKSIKMRQGSVARYHAVQWQGSLYRRIDANCDGIPDNQ